MKKYNLSQAAKVAGVARSTIYNDIHRGLLHPEVDARGQKCIDHFELMRLYNNAGVGTSETSAEEEDHAQWEAEIRLLKQRNRYLETLLKESRQREREANERYEKMFELAQEQARVLADKAGSAQKGGLLRRLRNK